MRSLTQAEIHVLQKMGGRSDILRRDQSRWWVDPEDVVKEAVALSLIEKGYILQTRQWEGVIAFGCYTRTSSGADALTNSLEDARR